MGIYVNFDGYNSHCFWGTVMTNAESFAKLMEFAEEKIAEEASKAAVKFDRAVKYKGKIDSHLNPLLILKQKLTEEDVEEIKRLHVIRLELFDYMRKPEVVADKVLLHECANGMEMIEFAMQKAWKFDRDRTKHSWWYRVPNCKCPKFDNEERFGVNHRIINLDCPCHGEL
jgi:hypothetical protein